MDIFKKTIKYSKPSIEIDNKIKDLNEGLKKTKSTLSEQKFSEEEVDEILSQQIVDVYNWKEIFNEEVVSEYEKQIDEIRDRHNDLIKVQGSIEYVKNKEVKEIFSELYQGEVERVVDTYVSKYSNDIINLREDLFHEIKKEPVVDLRILEEKINLLTLKYNQLSEGLLNEPSTGLEDPVTFDHLKNHYQLLVGRLQEQLSTLGGGGEVRLQYLDDIVGIATNAAVYDDKFLKYNHSLKKFEFVTATGIGFTGLSVTTNSFPGTAALSYNNEGVFTYTPPDLSSFLNSSSLVGYATEGYVNNSVVGFITTGALSGLASEAFVGLATIGLASEAFVGLATIGLASEAFVGLATIGLASEALVGLATQGLASQAFVGLATQGLASQAFVGLATQGLASQAFVGLATQGLASEAFVGLATQGLASEAFVGLATQGLASQAFVGLATQGLASQAFVGLATAGLASEAFVGLATAGLASQAFVGLATQGLASEAFVGLATAGLASQAFVGLATQGLASEAFVGLATAGLASEGFVDLSIVGLASEGQTNSLQSQINALGTNLNIIGFYDATVGVVTSLTVIGETRGYISIGTTLPSVGITTGDYLIISTGGGDVGIASYINTGISTAFPGDWIVGVGNSEWNVLSYSQQVVAPRATNADFADTLKSNSNVNTSGVITATSFSGSGANLTSIPNGALTNSSIAIGGVTLNLGDTDATPAFNLSDATAYPYTSLTGISTSIVGDTTPQLGGNLDLNSKFITGTGGINVSGVATATSFSGSGIGLTGLTGASAGTYGNATNSAQITVDTNGRIASITQTGISGGGGGGISGINVFNSGTSVGITTNLEFKNNITATSIGNTVYVDVSSTTSMMTIGVRVGTAVTFTIPSTNTIGIVGRSGIVQVPV